MKRALTLLSILCLTGCVLLPGAGMGPVRVEGGRFFVGDRPWFPTTNFLTAGDQPRKAFTHTYFAEGRTDAERLYMRSTLLREGYNCIFVYTINENDYRSTTRPYRDGQIGGAFDDEKLARWHDELQRLVEAGLRPILWLFPDDSPTVHRASDEELERYIQKMVDSFDDLPLLWVLALEADEYWPLSRVDRLGAYLKSRTRHPVGVHQIDGQVNYMGGDWVDFAVYQSRHLPRAFAGPHWEFFYDDFLETRARIPDRKPFFAAEYAWNTAGKAAAQRGLAAAFAGAQAVGNGAPAGLAAFMERVPAGLTPSRNGAVLLLTGDGVHAEANLNALTFRCRGCDP